MKKYEIMTISNISLGEEGARQLSNSIKDLINSLNGKVLNSDFWGKKRFAYPINHDEEGFYEVIEAEIEADSINELKQKFNLMDGLTRYLINLKG